MALLLAELPVAPWLAATAPRKAMHLRVSFAVAIRAVEFQPASCVVGGWMRNNECFGGYSDNTLK